MPVELKTSPPAHRAGLVVRRELLSRIDSSSAPVIALVAPSGYGKTTVLSQFFERADRPVAWLSLDSGDGDPKVLISGLSGALAGADLLEAGTTETNVVSGAVLTRGVNQLLGTVDPDQKGVLIIDHVDQVPTRHALDVIGAVLARARDRLQVICATRSSTGLPFGLLRARGDLLELGMSELALNASETNDLFEAVGARGDVSIEGVMDITEGWPVSIYLTALAIKAGAPPPGDLEIHGNDRYLADYFREELMRDLSSDMESFLLRTSILPRMSGDLCDYVLESEHSAQTLDRLQELNLLVIPMDRTRTWYRYHSLLQDFLQAELHHRDAGEEPALHSRASTWFEDKDFPQLAIEHARLAGDYDRVARLLGDSARSFYASGHSETLVTWFDWLEDNQILERYPELAAVGALMRALDGDPGGAERIAHIAYNDFRGRPGEETDLGPLTLMSRAYQAPRGVDQALADAGIAYEKLKHEREWAHASLGALALNTMASHGIEAAEPLWTDTLWQSESIDAHPLAAVARAMRGVAAIRRGDWEAAATLLGDTPEELVESGLETYVTSCLAFITAARICVHNEDLEKGRSYMAAAAAIRPRLTAALPVYSVGTLHEKARAYVELADIAGARRVIRDAADILAIRPRLGMLVPEHQEMRERLTALPAGTVGPSSLTGAELRLLPLLVTHLTYPEIGDRLYVSRHTVKTQAMSIYRKLGVSSRSEAVSKAREIGLIST